MYMSLSLGRLGQPKYIMQYFVGYDACAHTTPKKDKLTINSNPPGAHGYGQAEAPQSLFSRALIAYYGTKYLGD